MEELVKDLASQGFNPFVVPAVFAAVASWMALEKQKREKPRFGIVIERADLLKINDSLSLPSKEKARVEIERNLVVQSSALERSYEKENGARYFIAPSPTGAFTFGLFLAMLILAFFLSMLSTVPFSPNGLTDFGFDAWIAITVLMALLTLLTRWAMIPVVRRSRYYEGVMNWLI